MTAKTNLLQRLASHLSRRLGQVATQAGRGRLVGPASALRQYAGARPSRTSPGFGSYGNSSADAELATSLTALRSRSRQLVRDNPYARRAKQLVVNNVIGPGVGLQAQVMTTRGALNATINSDLEEVFCEWSCPDSCHTGGRLHFADMERLLMGQVFEAGEAFVRLHPRAFGDSRVPLALEVIEPERLANELVDPGTYTEGGMAAGHELRMGVEVDEFHRPVAYWIRKRHPGDIRARTTAIDRFERVPAADIIHLALIDRWPQTRGEPWMHTVLRKLDDMGEYSGSEVQAARAASYYFGTIKTPADDNPLRTGEDDDGGGFMAIEPLSIQELKPGEEFNFHAPSRPNTGMDGFLRYMLREVASGVGVSYESLSRDYSQSNYSSSRLALLDDRDLWRVLQQWWLRTFRARVHKVWLQQAVLARAVTSISLPQYMAEPEKFAAARFKCRGWGWVDPVKEVNSAKEAIKGGLTTLTDVLAEAGKDIEDVIATRRRELDLLDDAEIDVDTTVPEMPEAMEPGDPGDTEPGEPPDASDGGQEDPPAGQQGKQHPQQPATRRVVSFRSPKHG